MLLNTGNIKLGDNIYFCITMDNREGGETRNLAAKIQKSQFNV